MKNFQVNPNMASMTLSKFKKWHKSRCKKDNLTAEERFEIVKAERKAELKK